MDNIESFREYLLGHFPILKLPKGKNMLNFLYIKEFQFVVWLKKDAVIDYLDDKHKEMIV